VERDVPYKSYKPPYKKVSFWELKDFCKKYKLKYNFDTIDDIVEITSPDVDMRLLLTSGLIYFNGRVFSIKSVPFYSQGKIFVPGELANFFSLKSKEAFRLLPLPISIKTIVIDPGHGGKDPGAISRSGLKEKDVNLKVSRYLKSDLEAKGFKVYLTRDRDVYLTLKQRVELAKRYDADLFISIHANANRSRKVRGFEVYYLSERYFDSESKALVMAENASLGFEENNLSKNTSRIVWDLICTENNALSLEFANIVISTFKRMGFYTRLPRGAPFYVLKYAYIPSVLVEVGYLTNYNEEKLLRKSHYLKQVSKGIAISIDLLNRRYAKFTSSSR